MISERKLQEIETVKKALNDLNDALLSEEYSNDFEFRSPPNAESELKQGTLKSIARALNDRGIGFDPSLIIQHIEKEVLNQFNDVVVSHLKGKSVSSLMSLKHELEKFDLKDRVDFFSKKLTDLEKELGVEPEKKKKTTKK